MDSALDKYLTFHKRSCTYYIFSGTRACSCGRDKALDELERYRMRIRELEQELQEKGVELVEVSNME